MYPYTGESQLVYAVSVFVGAGLREAASALLIMEQSHCELLRRRLLDDGFNVSELESLGQLAIISAEPLMAIFLFDGIIDEHRFKSKVGEIVNLLWTPDPKSTHRLEELWNDLIKLHSVPLLCAYKLGGARSGRSSRFSARLSFRSSRVISAPPLQYTER